MFTLNFKKQFAEAVETGRKLQTIRAPRKDGKKPKAGDHIRLYTGLRTKGCRLLRCKTCGDEMPMPANEELTGAAPTEGETKP